MIPFDQLRLMKINWNISSRKSPWNYNRLRWNIIKVCGEPSSRNEQQKCAMTTYVLTSVIWTKRLKFAIQELCNVMPHPVCSPYFAPSVLYLVDHFLTLWVVYRSVKTWNWVLGWTNILCQDRDNHLDIQKCSEWWDEDEISNSKYVIDSLLLLFLFKINFKTVH